MSVVLNKHIIGNATSWNTGGLVQYKSVGALGKLFTATCRYGCK